MRNYTARAWATRLAEVLVLLWFAGCGPNIKYIPKQVRALQSLQTCSQGPFTIELITLGAPRGEQLEVRVCSAHAVAGRYIVTVGSSRREGSYGSDTPDNQRCLASPVQRAPDAGSAAPPSGARSAHTPAPQAAAEPTSQTVEQLLQPVPWSAPPKWCPEAKPNGGYSYTWSSERQVCPCGLEETRITSMEWSDELAAPLRAGEKVQVRLWSVEPNDLQGVLFVARQLALDPSTTQKKWRAALQRESARWAAAAARPTPPATRTPAGPTSPPPRARAENQPPRPSVHAEWAPGYWHFGEADWSWIQGWWRVPQRDIAGNLTARAPSGPPSPRVEPVPPFPFAGAVWLPGQWHWSGHGWVWVGGAWGLPPGRGLRWQAPAWRIRSGGAVLVPGGWVAGDQQAP